VSKELALQNAVDAQRLAVRWAKVRGASPEAVAAMESALARVLVECARIGRGPTCACGAVLAEHDLEGRRVDEARDGYGMKWGERELCAGFRAVEVTQ
jgi:hypothetical protein